MAMKKNVTDIKNISLGNKCLPFLSSNVILNNK